MRPSGDHAGKEFVCELSVSWVGPKVDVGMDVGVLAGVGVCVGAGVLEGMDVGVFVGMDVGVLVGVAVCVGVGVFVGMGVGVLVGVGVCVGEGVLAGVSSTSCSFGERSPHAIRASRTASRSVTVAPAASEVGVAVLVREEGAADELRS